jgi:peptidoglycan pentaglycine glycine transferase (the first glycine)
MNSPGECHLEDAEWDRFVAASPFGHFLQTSPWGALKSRFGWTVEHVALSRGGTPIAGAQVLYRTGPLGLTLAYVPKGPVVNWDDDQTVDSLLAALRRAARRRRAFCLKLEPELLDDPARVAKLTRLGLRRSWQGIQPQTTLVVDLARGEDETLAAMKPKWRYNIRLAARRGVLIRVGTPDDVPAFVSLIQETALRDAFEVHSPEYYTAACQLLAPTGSARLFVARHRDRMLAGILVFVLGQKAWYMYGASGNEYRNLMPNYLLQWHAITWARSIGCTTYDLWGIPDEVGVDPEAYSCTETGRTGQLWGVYRFKQGFGGQVVRYAGVFDDVYLGLPYQLYNWTAAFLERRWGGAWHRRLRMG